MARETKILMAQSKLAITGEVEVNGRVLSYDGYRKFVGMWGDPTPNQFSLESDFIENVEFNDDGEMVVLEGEALETAMKFIEDKWTGYSVNVDGAEFDQWVRL